MGPKVTIHSISRLKISDEPQTDRAVVLFSFDGPVIEHRTMVLGVSPQTGYIADSASRTVDGIQSFTVDEVMALSVNEVPFVQDITETIRTVDQAKLLSVDAIKLLTIDNARAIREYSQLTAEIDWTELYQEGNNRVNIYGKNIDGEWTPYEG